MINILLIKNGRHNIVVSVYNYMILINIDIIIDIAHIRF